MWTIIIISTDLRIITGLRSALERAGFNPIVTESLVTALIIIQNTHVDMIICDASIEGGTGIASCITLRNQLVSDVPKMLVMEEEGSASNRIAAIYAGALGILDKSSSVSETVGAIWKYIEMGAYNPAMKPEISETSTTGIPDTGRTMHRMKLEWALASRQASALTAVLIHLDRFDAIRKCMGQKIASQLLSQSFRAIEATLRTRDYLGSCSKNVFCAILPDLDIQQASEVVHRIRRQFRDTRFGDVDTPLSITLSIGACAVAKVDPKMSNQIVAHAEEEMQYLMARGGDAAIIRQYTSEDTDNRIFVGEPLKVARDQQGRNKNDELNLLHRRSGSGQKGSVEHHPAIRDRAPSPGAGSIDAMHFG